MTIKDRQAAKPYNPLDYNRDQSPPAIIPFHEVPVGGEDDPDDPEYNEEHELYWCFGRSAGGAQLWFGKYHGQRIYQTSWSYLHWCKSNLQKSWRFRQAFEIYAEGARNYAREHYKDFFVPLGRYYRGKTLRQCRDKPWMLHVQAKARREPEWREKNEAFFIALDEWLANPRKEQVKRDVGERLHPSQYDEDLGEVAEDEYDDQDLIDADADPDGNLKGFVVPDSVTPEPEEQEKDELDLADERLEAQRKAKRKARLTSSHKIMPEEDEISEDTDGDESEEEASSSSPQSEAYPTPPPETPKKSKQTRRAQSPSIIDDDGKVDDEADWVPDPEDQDSQVEETPRRLTRSMGRPKATGARSSPPATPSAHRRIAAAHLAPRTSRAKVLPTPAPESESDEVQARNPVKRPAKRKAIVDSTSEEEDNTPLSELRSRKRVKTGSLLKPRLQLQRRREVHPQPDMSVRTRHE